MTENGVKGILRPSGTPGSGNGGEGIHLVSRLADVLYSPLPPEESVSYHHSKPLITFPSTAHIPVVQFIPLPAPSSHHPLDIASEDTDRREAGRVMGSTGTGRGDIARCEFRRKPRPERGGSAGGGATRNMERNTGAALFTSRVKDQHRSERKPGLRAAFDRLAGTWGHVESSRSTPIPTT